MTRISLLAVVSLVLACQPQRRVPRVAVQPGVGHFEVRNAFGDPCERETVTEAETELEVWTFCRMCPTTKRNMDVFASRRRAQESYSCDQRKVVTFVSGKVTRVELSR